MFLREVAEWESLTGAGFVVAGNAVLLALFN
jgi:hypothetical protein